MAYEIVDARKSSRDKSSVQLYTQLMVVVFIVDRSSLSLITRFVCLRGNATNAILCFPQMENLEKCWKEIARSIHLEIEYE